MAVGAVSGGMAAFISCPAEVSLVRMANDNSLPAAERRNYKRLYFYIYIYNKGGKERERKREKKRKKEKKKE